MAAHLSKLMELLFYCITELEMSTNCTSPVSIHEFGSYRFELLSQRVPFTSSLSESKSSMGLAGLAGVDIDAQL